MKVYEAYPIGSHYKKENIYLGRLKCGKKTTIEYFKSLGKLNRNTIDSLEKLFDSGMLVKYEIDLFYKDENGYFRFCEDGPETIKGDNSDGMGTIVDLVSIWDYCSEDEICEAIINNSYLGVALKTDMPIIRYTDELAYNKEKTLQRKLN